MKSTIQKLIYATIVALSLSSIPTPAISLFEGRPVKVASITALTSTALLALVQYAESHPGKIKKLLDENPTAEQKRRLKNIKALLLGISALSGGTALGLVAVNATKGFASRNDRAVQQEQVALLRKADNALDKSGKNLIMLCDELGEITQKLQDLSTRIDQNNALADEYRVTYPELEKKALVIQKAFKARRANQSADKPSTIPTKKAYAEKQAAFAALPEAERESRTEKRRADAQAAQEKRKKAFQAKVDNTLAQIKKSDAYKQARSENTKKLQQRLAEIKADLNTYTAAPGFDLNAPEMRAEISGAMTTDERNKHFKLPGNSYYPLIRTLENYEWQERNLRIARKENASREQIEAAENRVKNTWIAYIESLKTSTVFTKARLKYGDKPASAAAYVRAHQKLRHLTSELEARKTPETKVFL